jgi:hypothetical protein
MEASTDNMVLEMDLSEHGGKRQPMYDLEKEISELGLSEHT